MNEVGETSKREDEGRRQENKKRERVGGRK